MKEDLLQYLSRLEEKNAFDDWPKEEFQVKQTVPTDPKSITPKDPGPQEKPKFETKKATPLVIPLPREFARGPLAPLYNSLGLNKYEPEPQNQSAFDDTFLESIQSTARPATAADITRRSSYRTKLAIDIEPLKSLAKNVVEKGDPKYDSHEPVQSPKRTMPSSTAEIEKTKKVKDKAMEKGNVVVGADVGADGGNISTASQSDDNRSQAN